MSSNPRTIGSALREAGQRLAGASDSPQLDARVLMGAALRRPAAWLLAHSDDALAASDAQIFARLLARRAAGEPVAYVLGRREFWSLELAVTPATLIPRPDTETLVQVALRLAEPCANPAFLDLGTGSGAIALALAHERRDAAVVATDRCAKALAVAHTNVEHCDTSVARRVTLRMGDWYDALTDADGPFDVIVSNPPYIRRDDPHLVRGDVRFEPRRALVAGADGLAEYRRIAPRALRHLTRGGWLAVEHGADQAEAVTKLLRHAHLRDVATVRDLAGQPRVTCGRRD